MNQLKQIITEEMAEQNNKITKLIDKVNNTTNNNTMNNSAIIIPVIVIIK